MAYEFNTYRLKPKKDEKLPYSGGNRHGNADPICHRYTIQFKHVSDMDYIPIRPSAGILDGLVGADRGCSRQRNL